MVDKSLIKESVENPQNKSHVEAQVAILKDIT